MPARVSVLPRNTQTQVNNSSLNLGAVSILLYSSMPSAFFYGQLIHALTTKSHAIELSKWQIYPWSTVLGTALIYTLGARVLSQEYSKNISERNFTKAKCAFTILASGCLVSSIVLSYLPYFILSKEQQESIASLAEFFSVSYFTITSFIAYDLYRAITRR
ncbi:MAG TPA: hypothetical protein VLG44_00010 [Chlamydiales bacterium]|nr:hypothetical protein [Chlamydiales bacterium]